MNQQTLQKYIDRINNPLLKKLITESDVVEQMDENEKSDFIIKASVIHMAPELERGLIEELKREKADKTVIINEVLKTKVSTVKQDIKDIKGIIRKEREKNIQKDEQEFIAGLENSIINLK